MVNSEELREELDGYAVMKKECSFRYFTNNGGIINLRDRVSRTYMEGEVIYLQTEKGLHIEIGKLVEVNGKSTGDFC